MNQSASASAKFDPGLIPTYFCARRSCIRKVLAPTVLLLAACAHNPPAPEPAPTPPPASIQIPVEPPLKTTEVALPAGAAPGPQAQPVCSPAAKPDKKARPIKTPVVDAVSKPIEKTSAQPEIDSDLRNVRPIAPGDVLAVLGKKVWGPSGDDMGRVIDVLVDPSGKIRSAVIDFGGFLGVGNRKIAVDWSLLKFRPGASEKQVVLTLDRDQVLAAPEYKESAKTAEVVAPTAGK